MANVPNLPGVPALPSYSGNVVAILLADVVTAISTLTGDTWGIFDSDTGLPAFDYNSVLDFDFKQDFPISDYPVEDGGFLSYDKVQLPFDVRVRVVSGGFEFQRQNLFVQVLAAANSLTLFDVVTPEYTFQNCNVTHVDFKRQSHNGLGVLVVDIWFVEIRITSTSTFSNTQNPTTAGQQSGGNVTGQAPSSSFEGRFTGAPVEGQSVE